MRDRKADAKGRSTGKLRGKRGQWRRPPKGEAWVWVTRELLSSPSWRAMSIHARKLMDFLLIEYMSHAGLENGRLMATYDQLEAWGIPRRKIWRAIWELERLGLIQCEHGGRWAMTNRPSTFRLTFFPDYLDSPATNDWKRVDDEKVRRLKRRQKQNPATKKDTTVVPPYDTTEGLRVIEGGR